MRATYDRPTQKVGRVTTGSYILPYDHRKERRVSGWRRFFLGVAALYPLLLVGLSLAQVVAPQREGLFALLQVFALYLFLLLALLLPFVFMRGAMALRVALVACALVFCLRFFPRLDAPVVIPAPGSTQVSVVSWNVRVGGEQAGRIGPVLRSRPAEVVALIEADWEWLYEDQALAEVYPYRLVHPTETATGMALLSIYPILEHGIVEHPRDIWDIPRVMWARLDLEAGRTVLVVVAHPSPPSTSGRNCSSLTCYATAKRDMRIAATRDFVEAALRRGDNLLLVGDFNVTDREPAYQELTVGLRDAHKRIGTGLGNTWGPASLMNKSLPLLRIDYQFSSPNVTPLKTSVDCTPRGSDHCMVYGTFAIE
ncbi:MAG TPA: endonuclease/exonuclease/phosphatase family protein [Chloroflexia bacterium]|nr:endonuclease/exonuclease/phosphatase family protein [Chloroflexia bacterium]